MDFPYSSPYEYLPHFVIMLHSPYYQYAYKPIIYVSHIINDEGFSTPYDLMLFYRPYAYWVLHNIKIEM